MGLPIMEYGLKFDFQKSGNYSIYHNSPYLAPRDTVLTFNFKFLKGGTITTYQARRIEIVGENITILSTTNFLGLTSLSQSISTTGYSTYYQPANDLLSSNLAQGNYYIYLSDGTFEFQSEIFSVLAQDDFDEVVISNLVTQDTLSDYDSLGKGYVDFISSVTVTRSDITKNTRAVTGKVTFNYNYVYVNYGYNTNAIFTIDEIFTIPKNVNSIVLTTNRRLNNIVNGGTGLASSAVKDSTTLTDTYNIKALITKMTAYKSSNWTTGLTFTSDVNDLTVDWGDGSVVENITQNVEKTHNYTTPFVERTIKIYSSSTSITKFIADTSLLTSIQFFIKINTTDFQIFSNSITSLRFANLANTISGKFYAYSCTSLVSLNLAYVTVTTTDFRVFSNTLMSSIIFKNTTNTISGTFQCYSNPVLTTLNLAYVTVTTTIFYSFSNTLMTSIIFKNTTNTIAGTFQCYSNPVLTTLNLAYVTVTTTGFYSYSNTLMTSVIFKNTTNTIAGTFLCYSNPVLTTLDFSYVTITTTGFYSYSNTLMTSIIFKNTTNTIAGDFWLYSCKLNNGLNTTYLDYVNNVSMRLDNNAYTATAINRDLYNRNLDSATGGNFNAAGTNAAPDTTSGGINGVAEKSALQAKSVSVNTN